MAEAPRNALGAHAEALIADVLNKREQTIITSVLGKLMAGQTLDPQYAIQQWIAIAEQRRIRSTLIQRSAIENARIAETEK